MITRERKFQMLQSWIDEQNESWRDDCEEYEAWRQDLTAEERELVKSWDSAPPHEDIAEYEAWTQEQEGGESA